MAGVTCRVYFLKKTQGVPCWAGVSFIPFSTPKFQGTLKKKPVFFKLSIFRNYRKILKFQFSEGLKQHVKCSTNSTLHFRLRDAVLPFPEFQLSSLRISVYLRWKDFLTGCRCDGKVLCVVMAFVCLTNKTCNCRTHPVKKKHISLFTLPEHSDKRELNTAKTTNIKKIMFFLGGLPYNSDEDDCQNFGKYPLKGTRISFCGRGSN